MAAICHFFLQYPVLGQWLLKWFFRGHNRLKNHFKSHWFMGEKNEVICILVPRSNTNLTNSSYCTYDSCIQATKYHFEYTERRCVGVCICLKWYVYLYVFCFDTFYVKGHANLRPYWSLDHVLNIMCFFYLVFWCVILK